MHASVAVVADAQLYAPPWTNGNGAAHCPLGGGGGAAALHVAGTCPANACWPQVGRQGIHWLPTQVIWTLALVGCAGNVQESVACWPATVCVYVPPVCGYGDNAHPPPAGGGDGLNGLLPGGGGGPVDVMVHVFPPADHWLFVHVIVALPNGLSV